MANERVALVGTVSMTVIGPDGNLRAQMHGRNRVLRRGRSLVAAALAGQAASPTFRILLGEDGSVTDDDELIDLIRPITPEFYTEETAVTLTLDSERAMFQLVTTFMANKDIEVAESGIQMTPFTPSGAPAEKTVATKTASRLSRTAVVPTPVASTSDRATLTAAASPEPVLYNRAVVEPRVSLRAGDRLTVTWTVAFVPA